MIKENVGVMIPKILLPKKDINLAKWAVVACDQFTSQEDYWRDVANIVSSEPSTFNLVFPEVYLGDNDEERIKTINENMASYIKKDLFEEREGLIYVERTLNNGDVRKGLMVAIDLEAYDYNKGSSTLIRATEGTIVERLPPRIKIRQDASIELPHIMVLIDDPGKKVIEAFGEKKESLELAYETKLMKEGGSIKGYWLSEDDQENFLINLMRLSDNVLFKEKYSLKEDLPVLLFAMGDGNHSLATAKVIWENLKKNFSGSKEDLMQLPARFALVELVNVYDDSLNFEPIHRVVFNCKKDILEAFKDDCSSKGIDFIYQTASSSAEVNELIANALDGEQKVGFVRQDEFGVITLDNAKANLAVGTLQDFLDKFVPVSAEELDYVHGDLAVKRLAVKENNAGFFLPAMSKDELFRTVILDGALPRKTFSMGHAEDKRYYLEARRIK